MKEIFLALLTEVVCGLVFRAVNLPIPAPPVLSGIVGIVEIFIGYKVFDVAVNILKQGW